MALDDYGAHNQSGMNLAPEFNREALQRAQVGEVNAETQQARAQTAALQQKQIRAEAFQNALARSDGSPSAVAHLMMQFPEVADHIKQGWDVQDKAKTDADLTTTAEIYSAATSGKWDLAKKLAHTRADAERAAGHTDPTYEAALEAMDRAAEGNPKEQKAVLNLLGAHLAAVTGPEHFGTVYGALKGTPHVLGPGAVLVDENNDVVAHSPLVQGADGTLYDYNSVMGGAAGKGGDTSAPASGSGGDGGFDKAVAFSLKHEGGYNPSDMNGAPVNFGINQGANPGIDVKSLTKDGAAQIYKTKYWDQSGAARLPAAMQTPYFDTYIINPARAKAFLAKSGDDPNKFMDMREAWMKAVVAKHPEYAKAYATRNADLRATIEGADTSQPYYTGGSPASSGGPRVLLPGKQGDQFENVTGDQAKAQGLDPNATWKVNTRTHEATKLADAKAGTDTDPQEIEDAATQFLLTGQMPALGNGAAGIKQQILKGRTALMQKLGIKAEQLPAFQAQYGADKTALQQSATLLSSLESSENALKANGQQVWNTHRQLVQDGIISTNPFITRQRLKYYANFGTPDEKAHVKTYLDAVNAYSAEYSKFMTAANGMGGSAAPSDSARTQAGELNDPGLQATPLLAHLRQGLIEAKNRRNGVAQQKQHLEDRLSSYLHPHDAHAASSPLPEGAKVVGTYHGKRVIELNGKRMVEQ